MPVNNAPKKYVNQNCAFCTAAGILSFCNQNLTASDVAAQLGVVNGEQKAENFGTSLGKQIEQMRSYVTKRTGKSAEMCPGYDPANAQEASMPRVKDTTAWVAGQPLGTAFAVLVQDFVVSHWFCAYAEGPGNVQYYDFQWDQDGREGVYRSKKPFIPVESGRGQDKVEKRANASDAAAMIAIAFR